MSDPINWYQSQRSTEDLWFASVDPTLPAPWRSVIDESSGLVFYWNPETNVSQYEHPNPAPPPPPYPPPDHYQIPNPAPPTFPYSSCNYRPPDYPSLYMPEVPVPPSYTSPIFLPHPAPPSVMYSDSIDSPKILHSYATNPNFHDLQIYSPSSYEQTSWVFDQVSHYELDMGLDSTVQTAPATGNVFSIVRGIRHTSKQSSLKSGRNLAVVSFVRMKRNPPSESLCQRRYRNRLITSLASTPPRASANSTTMVDDVRIKARKQEEFQFRMAEFQKRMITLNNQQAALQETLMEEFRLLRLARVPPNLTWNILDPDLLGMTKSTPTVLEFTMVALAPVLHCDGLGKQVTSVTKSASSLGVCQDTIQTTMTTVPPPFSSPTPLTTTSHFESVEIAPRSEHSLDHSQKFGYSPTRPLSMSSLQPSPRLSSQIRSSPPSKLQDHHVPPLLLASPLLTAMATPLVNPHSTVSAVAIIPFPNFVPVGMDILPKNSEDKVAGLLQPEDQDDIVNSEWYGDHQSFKLKNIHLHKQPLTHIKNSEPEVFPYLSHSSYNSRAILHSLLNAKYSTFLNDKYGWVILYLVGKFVKMELTAAELFDEMSKRPSDGIIETIFNFMSQIYHLQWLIPCRASSACAKYLTIFEPLLCCNFASQPKLRNLDTLTISLHLAFSPLLTILLEFQLVWDPGHAFYKLSYAAFALVFSFRSKWMMLDHDELEVFVLSGKQGFTFSYEIFLVEFLDNAIAYVLPVSLTSFGLPIFVASELVKEKYSCYFQKFLSMLFSLAVGTEPLDGLFTINSNPFQLETFKNMLVTWVTQPTARFLLDGMHYHGVLNMAFLSESQRLLQVIEIISKYMSPLVASYLAYANQIHVVLAFYIDSIGILTDFGKHFDGDEYVSWCHFNAKYNVDLMAALFMVHTTHIRLMKMYFPDPTTSLPPAQVRPPVFILVLYLVSHFHMLESDHIYLGKGNQVPATDINCMHNWLNGNVLHVGTWFGEAIVFLSLHIWNEILRSHFVLVAHFHHHGTWRVTLANMRAALDSAIWFSVYKGFTIIGWNLFTALVRVNMIHILYGEGIKPSLSRSVRGSNKTEWKRNACLIHFFTYAVQSNEAAVIWFLTSDSSSAAWIRHVCSLVDQMTNPFKGVPKCFDYWKGLADFAFFLHHPRATYGMLGADSLLYFMNYQGIQSSMESLNWWDISSTFSGVLRNNNWPSLTKLGVFLFTKHWVCKLWEHLFMSINSVLIIRSATSWIDHPMGVTEPKNLNTNIRSWLLLTTSTETWVPAAQNAENYLDSTCHSFGELVVGDAPTPIVILFNAVKISALQLFSSISVYLANLHDFILAGYQLLIFVFWVNTLNKFWKDMVRDLKTIQKLILHMSMVLHWTKWVASFPIVECIFPSLSGLRTSLILRGRDC